MKIKRRMVAATVTMVDDWPIFVPVDAQATCLVCAEPWTEHGTKSSHCPPCGAYVPDKQLRTTDCCNKIVNHKGECGVVTKSPSKKGKRWGKWAPRKKEPAATVKEKTP